MLLLLAMLLTSVTAFPLIPRTTIPQYVLDYAPLVYLDPSEVYFPSSIAAQLSNTYPASNFTHLNVSQPTLSTLSTLNTYNPVYLSSDTFTTSPSPSWLLGVVPSSGTTNTKSATIITYQHDGYLDAFYFYFYAYNQGNTVLFHELGDHLGDWEHTMVRFNTTTSTPNSVWLSQHSGGTAYTYAALEKQGTRAVVYSAKGTHATYATAGGHDHTIPGLPLEYGLLEDHTGKGALWDPVLDAFMYEVTFDNGMSFDGDVTDWLYFEGMWGNEQLPDSDPAQKDFFGFRKYTSGPTGPRDKSLQRTNVCPGDGLCIVNEILFPGS